MESAHSRSPSGVGLREYYRGKSEKQAAPGFLAAPQQQHLPPPQQQQHARQRVPQPTHGQSAVGKLLAHISPQKSGNSRQSDCRKHEAPLQRKPAAVVAPPTASPNRRVSDDVSDRFSRGSGAVPADSDNTSDGIPAFRPPSPTLHAHIYAMPPHADGASSPGKAQLQAVRALAGQQQVHQAPLAAKQQQVHQEPRAANRQQAQQHQHQHQQQQQAVSPQDTPGMSQTSMGRAINAQIERSIANLLMTATPPHEVCGGSDQGSLHSHGQQQQPPQQHPQRRAGSLTPVSGMNPASSGRRLHSVDSRGSTVRAAPSPRPNSAPASPPCPPPVAPPPPAAPLTSLAESLVFEAQTFKSPMFMSRRQRSMYCEIDEPGSAIAFPKAHRRTGPFRRFLASAFGCFVPHASERSPAPSLYTPGGRRAPASQGASPTLASPKPALGMNPLRQSMAELTMSNPDMRDQLRACLAVQDGAQAGHSPLYSDLIGMQDEEAQANMASPVLPSRPASGRGTPAGLGHGEETDGDCSEGSEWEGGKEAPAAAQLLAKRNLMDVLRSREAGAVRQHQQGGQYMQAQQDHHHLQKQQQQRGWPHGLIEGRQQQQLQPDRYGGQQGQYDSQIIQHHIQQQQQPQHVGRPRSAHHLQPWQRERQAAPAALPPPAAMPNVAAKAKATHVSLAQLLSVGQEAQRPRQARSPDSARGRQPSTGSKRGREALGVSRAPSDDAPAFTPKRRDLSKPSYRSQALHQLLSPMADTAAAAAAHAARGDHPTSRPTSRQGANAAPAGTLLRPGSGNALRRSTSVPSSPLQAAPSALPPACGTRGESMPGSPLLGTRLTHAAAVRAEATQRKLNEREAQMQAVMAKSPDRWLRAAAAQGMTLREAAVLVSPGKSARPHYHPTPAAGRQRAQQRPGAAAAAAKTPGGYRFDSFCAGEEGVEPYSARLHTVERPRPAAARPAARAPMVGSGARPGAGVDFSQLAANGGEYMAMLQRLAQGLEVEQQQIAPFKRATLPPLPADLLAGAAAASQQEQVQQRQRQSFDGADTVRARVGASQEALASSRTVGSSVEYCLAEEQPASLGVAAEQPRRQPLPVPLTPHHNALYGNDLTPTKSSPLAQQRMVSMSAALVAEQQEFLEVQRAQQAQHGGGGSRQASSTRGASSASASISFGSGGCVTSTSVGQGGEPRGTAGAGRGEGSNGSDGRRLERLAALLEEREARGEHFTLAQLQGAGFSTHDLCALKQWLDRQ